MSRTRLSFPVLLHCCLLLVAAGSSARAQSRTPAERRAQFMGDLAKASAPLLKQASTALLAVEQQAAAARDYESALKAREERKKIEQQLADQEKLQLLSSAQQQTYSTVQTVELPLSQARLSGVQLDGASLIGWESAGATATWTLPKLPPGGYEVVLKYESSPTQGGTLRVEESFYSLKITLGTTLKGPTELNTGTLRVTDGSGSLTLRAMSVVGKALMRLDRITLIPAANG